MQLHILSVLLLGCVARAFVIPLTNINNSLSTSKFSSIQLNLAADSFDDSNSSATNVESNPGVANAWRYVKKPLLRIGGKGVTETHGNSLRELLNAHTCVKVKVNTQKLGSLEDAFESIKDLAEKSGNMKGIECIHIRPSDNIIMFGKPGAMDAIRAGEFPPAPEED